MRIVQINSCYGIGSTGKIVEGISKVLTEKDVENYIFYATGKSSENAFKIESKLYLKFNILKTRLFGKHGFYSHLATFKMLRKISEINPDVIHLHNIHGHYINVRMLFNYIKKHNIKVVWTLHDCWTFTGHCAHFDYAGCDKWKKGCNNCPSLKDYPTSWFFDRSAESYKDKKELFTGINDLTIITPSEWLAGLVKQSFLKDYPVKVINNGIDLESFKTIDSDFRKKHNLEDKFVIMGIAPDIVGKKGGKYLVEIAKRLNDCHVIIVGLEKNEKLPKNVITIPRTNFKEELAKIYSMADVYVNPTMEDTFPTVNLEALACGTPVVTFNTGGSPESVDENVGFVVEKHNIDELIEKISIIKNNIKNKYNGNCVFKAKSLYNEKEKFNEYFFLYDNDI